MTSDSRDSCILLDIHEFSLSLCSLSSRRVGRHVVACSEAAAACRVVEGGVGLLGAQGLPGAREGVVDARQRRGVFPVPAPEAPSGPCLRKPLLLSRAGQIYDSSVLVLFFDSLPLCSHCSAKSTKKTLIMLLFFASL